MAGPRAWRKALMYQMYSPHPALAQYIECFWFLQARLPQEAQLEEQIFTDARADLIFNFSVPYVRRRVGLGDQQALMLHSNLDAQRPYAVQIVQSGAIHLISVRFRPGGLAAFLPLPPSQILGETLGLNETLGPVAAELEGRLFDAQHSQSQQLALLNQFFLQRLKPPPMHALVLQMLATIEHQQGQLPIQSLSQYYGYSIRTVDRFFQQVLGLTPKFYARTVRFRYALRALMHSPTISWNELVADYGYYDQAHLSNEFRLCGGLQPEVFRHKFQRTAAHLAPNYVQFFQDIAEHIG